MKSKSNGTYLGAGVFSAIAASLCCIAPVIALVAGSSSVASSFSWMEPSRPYLMGLSILVLGLAWYLQFKPKKRNKLDCECESTKNHFVQSNFFLFLVTVFAFLMMGFPLYAKIFYASPKVNASVAKVVTRNKQQVKFTILGMSCESCEAEVNQELSKLKGVSGYKTSYLGKTSLVTFDSGQVNINKITDAISRTGYKVKGFEWVTQNRFHSNSCVKPGKSCCP